MDLKEIAAESLRFLRLDAQGKGLHLITDFKSDMPSIFADERAMRQICLNLISNAIKFTPENGVVAVRAALLPSGEAMLTVRDTGPGIPDEEIQTVLSAFGQGSLAQKMGDCGTGLGLPIVSGLAELHGGRFDLRSKPGVGTEASLILPKTRVVSTAHATAAARKAGENVMAFQMRGAA